MITKESNMEVTPELSRVIHYAVYESRYRDAYNLRFFPKTSLSYMDKVKLDMVNNIFTIFNFAQKVIYDMSLYDLFLFIETHFNKKWLAILASISYDNNDSRKVYYYSMIFVASYNVMLQYIDPYTAFESEEELHIQFQNALKRKEFYDDCSSHEISVFVEDYCDRYYQKMEHEKELEMSNACEEDYMDNIC